VRSRYRVEADAKLDARRAGYRKSRKRKSRLACAPPRPGGRNFEFGLLGVVFAVADAAVPVR
jgi:hypothetical protein